MATYTSANIQRFGGIDDIVDTDEAANGFPVVGTANYTGANPTVGDTVSMNFSFSDSGSQPVTAQITAVDTTYKTVTFGVNDPGLTLPEGPGTYTVSVSYMGTSVLSGANSPAHTFGYETTCFVRGTRIATPTGATVIENLAPGDLVTTASHGQAPVKWIGKRRINVAAYARKEMVAPVRIVRDAVEPGIPSADLLISPDHAVFIDGKLVCARQLVNGTSIGYDLSFHDVDYFHIELETHDIVLAEGLTVETYLDTGNRGFFSNASDPSILRPDLSSEADLPARAAASCAPFAFDEHSVQPIWDRLAARAALLGQSAPSSKTTSDPDLRIVAKGRTLRPIYTAGGLHIFVLPRATAEVRIVSRASSPAEIHPWLDDRRRLGVSVQRIVLRSADEYEEISVDSPHLSGGWWGAESEGRALWRWTSGEAVLPLPAMSGTMMLEIRAVASETGYLAEEAPDRVRQVA